MYRENEIAYLRDGDAYGRSGEAKTKALLIIDNGDAGYVSLYPITKRNRQQQCRISIPRDVATLRAIAHELTVIADIKEGLAEIDK